MESGSAYEWGVCKLAYPLISCLGVYPEVCDHLDEELGFKQFYTAIQALTKVHEICDIVIQTTCCLTGPLMEI